MSSFKKTAQMGALVGQIFGAPGVLKTLDEWIGEILNPESLLKNAVFFGALFQNWKTRYNPNAFYHVLEMENSRGYEAIDPYTGKPLKDPMTGEEMTKDGKPYVFQTSQGHLEKVDYNKLQNEINKIPAGKGGKTFEHQFSELKPQEDMPMFEKRNITINEDSPEYKQMFKKLYPGVQQPRKSNSNSRFVKVAQNDATSKQEEIVEKVKKLTPKWDIHTMISDLNKIAKSYEGKNLTEEERLQLKLSFEKKFFQYKDSIKPLHEYLEKNGFGQKNK